MMHSTPYSNCSTPRNKAPLCCAQPWILLESTRGHALAQGSAISKMSTCQRKVLGDLPLLRRPSSHCDVVHMAKPS